MKIDIGHTGYTVAMILLSFVAALVVTKTAGKYLDKNKDDTES